MDLREYRLMVAVGIGLAGIGMLALHVDALVPGAVALGIGLLIVLAGLVGTLWNMR
jgi:hypothetical protein